MNEDFLNRKLQERVEGQSFRQLSLENAAVDFCSNDYLGIVTNRLISFDTDLHDKLHGSTGSRLISGNYPLIADAEKEIARFHDAEAGLMFNSGYDANVGLLSCIAQRGDTLIYDQLSHASIRDGIRLSFAVSHSFAHNDMRELEKKIAAAQGSKFVVTESVFSMDGHFAPLQEIVGICERHDALLIVDEAHATGVVGGSGEGLVQELSLQKKVFARVHTFGKAVGAHGAIVLGSQLLRDYLINFSRPFIYTTAMPATAALAAKTAYRRFPAMNEERSQLRRLIALFREKAGTMVLTESATPIQGVIIPGNEKVRAVATTLQANGFDVRPILYPTVPKGAERLRVVLHSFNTEEQVRALLEVLGEEYSHIVSIQKEP